MWRQQPNSLIRVLTKERRLCGGRAGRQPSALLQGLSGGKATARRVSGAVATAQLPPSRLIGGTMSAQRASGVAAAQLASTWLGKDMATVQRTYVVVAQLTLIAPLRRGK